jgi:large subunit ribosomal protein L24
MTLATPRRLSGDIEADNADAGGLLAAAIGMPSVAKGNDKSWVWSTEPFTDGVFGNYAGSVTFKARRLDLTSQIAAREFRARLDFADRALTIGELAGDIGSGRLSGSIAWQDTDLGLKSEAKLALNGADAAALLPAGPRPPVTGKLDLSADIHGSGLSPIALIGSLQGEGKVVLVDGQLAGLDPRVFDTLTHAVDQGVSLDNERVANIVTKALDSGRLAVKRAELDYAVSAGQLRLARSQVESAAADLAVTGNVDLTDGTVDARLVLSGHDRESGSRPDIFLALRGPAPEPSRSVDVSAVTGWLTLRAVDNQAKRLKALEAAQPKPEPAPAPVVTPPQPPAPAGRSEAPDTSGSIPAPRTAPAVAPPAPRAAPKREMAPALPAPLDIKPAPQPGRAVDSRGGPTLLLSPQN